MEIEKKKNSSVIRMSRMLDCFRKTRKTMEVVYIECLGSICLIAISQVRLV